MLFCFVCCCVLFVVGIVVRGVWRVRCRLFCDVGLCCVLVGVVCVLFVVWLCRLCVKCCVFCVCCLFFVASC